MLWTDDTAKCSNAPSTGIRENAWNVVALDVASPSTRGDRAPFRVNAVTRDAQMLWIKQPVNLRR